MGSIKDKVTEFRQKGYSLLDQALRTIDSIPNYRSLRDVKAVNLKDCLERPNVVWTTPSQLRRGTFLSEPEIGDTLKRLWENDEIVISTKKDCDTGEPRFTTRKHYHDLTKLPLRILYCGAGKIKRP